jgi:hypothetical protein
MRQLRIGRTAGSDNDTPMNPLPQTIRGRDERRDRCLSVLEICHEFVSWRETGSLLSCGDLPCQELFAPFADCERKVRCFWFARCSTSN